MSENKIGLDVPTEPGPLSVVLDRDGFAWQRLGKEWVRCGAVLGFLGHTAGPNARWPNLLVDRGPVQVLHYGKANDERTRT